MAYLPSLRQIVVRSDAGAGDFLLTARGEPLRSDVLARAPLAVSIFFQIDHELTHPEQPFSSELSVVMEQNETLDALGLSTRAGYPSTVYHLEDNVFQWVVPQSVHAH